MKNEKELPIQKLCAWLEKHDCTLFDTYSAIGKEFLQLAYDCLELEKQILTEKPTEE